MFSLLNTLLFVHIIAAIIWVGGAALTQVRALRVMRAQDPAAMTAFAVETEWIGTHVFLPASLVLFAAGVWMTILSFSFTQTWIAVAVILWISSALVGSLFLGPEAKRIGNLVAERGPADAEVTSRIKRVFVVSRIELASFLVIIAMMVFKPGL